MRKALALTAVAAILAACGGGSGDGGTGPDPTPTPTVASVKVSAAGDVTSVQVGSAVQLTATPVDKNGNVVTTAGTVLWSSSNGTIATVDGNGRVSAVAAGSVTII